MPAGRSSGAARWFCLQEAEAEKAGGWIAWPEKSQRPGRGGGRAKRPAPGGSPAPPSSPASASPSAHAFAREDAGGRFSVGGTPAANAGRREAPRKSEPWRQRPRAHPFVWRPSAAPAALRRLPRRRRRSVRRGGRRGRRRSGAGDGPGPGTPAAGLARQKAGGLCPWARSFRAFRAPPHAPPALGFAPLPRWSRGNGVPGGEGVRNGACASCAGGRCPRFYGSSPGDRRSADRTYRKGTGGLPAFQRGKGRY